MLAAGKIVASGETTNCVGFETVAKSADSISVQMFTRKPGDDDAHHSGSWPPDFTAARRREKRRWEMCCPSVGRAVSSSTASTPCECSRSNLLPEVLVELRSKG